jgi:hypothetical protein
MINKSFSKNHFCKKMFSSYRNESTFSGKSTFKKGFFLRSHPMRNFLNKPFLNKRKIVKVRLRCRCKSENIKLFLTATNGQFNASLNEKSFRDKTNDFIRNIIIVYIFSNS